jgi:4-hydroxybutyrate CoA-transferase
MDWKTQYSSKIINGEEAIRKIKSGDHVFLSGNCSVPKVLLRELVAYAPRVENVEIYQALAIAGKEYVAPELAGHLRINSLFISANVRDAINEGRADFTPVLLSELPLLFKKKILPVDVALVHLSPPDRHGNCSFSVETGLTKSVAEAAHVIIAEVNEQMPRLLGDSFIHISKIAHLVPVDYPLQELVMDAKEGDGQSVEIMADHIAELIPDGATLQTGIGSIPNAVLKRLTNKKDLGIHTELFSDGVVDLVEKGVITGSRKTIHRCKIISGFMLGTQSLYKWAHDNSMIEMHPTEYVNSPFVIAQNARMVAINSALEVDFTGQICADSIGTRFYSGVGGQMDFVYGSSLSEGGLPIIVLPSTSRMKDGTIVSRIVPTLKPGAGITTTRNHIHYVVTEYGIVDLYGKSVRQRTRALISIAHPGFRDELEMKARQLHYI